MFILHHLQRRVPSATSSSCQCIQSSSSRFFRTTSLFLSSKKTHYETLGLTSTASHAEIKSAYYKLSMQHHPDKTVGGEEKFKDISTAYEVLGNPRLRRLYDRGIISHNDTDSTIHHAGGGGGPEESFSEQSENSRASVSSFDQWSKEHASAAFSRSQHEKIRRRMHENKKYRTSNEGGAEALIWIGFLVVVILSASKIDWPWSKTKKEP
jgi:DnaJ family protein C protein 30